MSRRQIAEHLQKLDEATVKNLNLVQDTIAGFPLDTMQAPEANASLIVAASNLAVAQSVRGLTGYVTNGLDLIAEATRAATRASAAEEEIAERTRLVLDRGLDRIALALGSLEQKSNRTDPRDRIRAARRNHRRSL